MPDKTGEWLQRIRQRMQTLRKRKEKTAMSCLTMVCLALFTCIGTLLHEVQSPGVLDVTGAFGAVLLHGGAEEYVLVGVLAFMAGAAVAVLGIRYGKDRRHSMKVREDREECI